MAKRDTFFPTKDDPNIKVRIITKSVGGNWKILVENESGDRYWLKPDELGIESDLNCSGWHIGRNGPWYGSRNQKAAR